ncbi:hypothetical protein POTOM_030695 [Populus tomentosa]|uniref:DUF4283 domain-containing protein n=1 Tax=Populus tomentosa TaxID=118781 RepID=A0A8X8CHW9_POPTO|nr:hypothetical protein POTOM_030695 [Populus tomentosa]
MFSFHLTEDGEDGCPIIKLSVEERKRIREPLRQTLIVKVIGRRVGYTYLVKRLHVLWRIQGGLSLVDLGNEFFLEKFSNAEDRDFALFEGPWMVADHYLTVRRWHPNFDPEEATIERRWRGGQEAAPVITSEVVEAYGQWMVAKKAGRKISKRSDSREISRPRNLRRFPQKARSESDLM